MDKSKYEREYTAFLETSRSRTRVAFVNVDSVISTIKKVINSGFNNEVRRFLQIVLKNLQAGHGLAARLNLRNALRALDDEYSEAHAMHSQIPLSKFETAISSLEQVAEQLKTMKIATIDSKLKEIETLI